MKKKLVLGMLAAAAVMQATSPAMAQFNDNRPGRFPEAPLPPPPPGQSLLEGSLEIQGVSRRSGGEWYRISLRRAVSLERLEITALAMRLKIHDGSLITEDGQRVAIREFRNTAVFGGNARVVSENLNLRSRIVAIDILAESYGGLADLRVTALSNDSRPQLVLGNLEAQRPQRPNRPDHGGNGICSRFADVTFSLQQLDSELSEWSRRKGAATYGTTEYVMADRELLNTSKRMVQIARSNDAKATRLEKLEVLAALFFQKMGRETYGTTQYQAYSEVGSAIFGAMGSGLQMFIECEIRTTAQLLARGDEFIEKMNRYTYGTVPYDSYSKLAQQIFAAAPNYYQQEVLRLDKNFMLINDELDAFHKKMNSYTYGTIGYGAYDALVNKGAGLSQASLRRLVLHMNSLQRFDLVKHFDNRKNAFTYGTVLYGHYVELKEIAAR